MNNLNANYERILKALRKISNDQLIVCQIRKPKLFDLEVIALSITAEYMSIDSENDLFRKLLFTISERIERSVYNRRRKRLVAHLDKILLKLASSFNDFIFVRNINNIKSVLFKMHNE